MGEQEPTEPDQAPLVVAPLADAPPTLAQKVAARWRLILGIALPIAIALLVIAVLPGSGPPPSVDASGPANTTTLFDPFGLAPPLDDSTTTTTLFVGGDPSVPAASTSTIVGATTTSTVAGSTAGSTTTTRGTTTTQAPLPPTPITVVATPGADEVTVTVHWGDAAYDAQTTHGASQLRIDFGDGVVMGRRSDLAYGPCEDQPTSTSPHDATAHHVYRAATAYTVTATITSVDSFTTLANRRTGTATASATPTAAGAGSNGPDLPKIINRGVSATQGNHLVSAGAQWCDADGYASQVTIDWGDGSEPQPVSTHVGACSDSPTAWPHTFPDEDVQTQHDYGSAGTWTVTFTLTTGGCGGLDEQTATATTTAQS